MSTSAPPSEAAPKEPAQRPANYIWFAVFCLAPVILCITPLTELATLAWTDSRYTHLPLVPLIAVALICVRRRQIFSEHPGLRWPGVPTVIVGTVAICLALTHLATPESTIPLAAVGLVLTWIGGFVGFYGIAAFKAALFPISLLLLFIPLPSSVVESAQTVLQSASGDVTYCLFHLAGTPVLRQGVVFSLPGFDIEIARECSGLRSTTALLITSLVLGYLFLRSGKRRLLFILFTIAVAIFKNALRITTLSWLALHVSRHYLFSDAHRYGGIPASAFALGLLVPALLLLQRAEFPRPIGAPPSPAPPASSPEV